LTKIFKTRFKELEKIRNYEMKINFMISWNLLKNAIIKKPNNEMIQLRYMFEFS